jgi:hypothetical protein
LLLLLLLLLLRRLLLQRLLGVRVEHDASCWSASPGHRRRWADGYVLGTHLRCVW